MPLYGRVAALQLFRPPGEARDLLLVLTERCKFCVLGWDEEAGRSWWDGMDVYILLRQAAAAAVVAQRALTALWAE